MNILSQARENRAVALRTLREARSGNNSIANAAPLFRSRRPGDTLTH